jgi:hypothetical protein
MLAIARHRLIEGDTSSGRVRIEVRKDDCDVLLPECRLP